VQWKRSYHLKKKEKVDVFNNKQVMELFRNSGTPVCRYLIFVPLKPIWIIGDSDSWSSDNWSSTVLLLLLDI
jgi:hypothetical protein